MGTENHYKAEEIFNCDECGNQISATFEVWEYPVGIHNYDTLTLEGAELLESFYFTIDFFAGDYEPDYTTCNECTEPGNFVDLSDERVLENGYDIKNENGKYAMIVSGNCNWCNTSHIRCPKCNSINSFPETEFNKEKECEGGCGLIFFADTSDDRDGTGEFSLKLLDHRAQKCGSCGETFIDLSAIGICDECEKKYEQE
jgi:hypothetical protein